MHVGQEQGALDLHHMLARMAHNWDGLKIIVEVKNARRDKKGKKENHNASGSTLCFIVVALRARRISHNCEGGSIFVHLMEQGTRTTHELTGVRTGMSKGGDTMGVRKGIIEYE
jgi:hypothetical protein